MSNIEQNLAFILSSRYGEDVRQAIHDAIHDCYEDGKAGAVDLTAREQIQEKYNTLAEQIANIVANSPTGSDKDSELVDVRVGSSGHTYTSAGLAVRSQISSIYDKANISDSLVDNFDRFFRWVSVLFLKDDVIHSNKLFNGTSYIAAGGNYNIHYEKVVPTIGSRYKIKNAYYTDSVYAVYFISKTNEVIGHYPEDYGSSSGSLIDSYEFDVPEDAAYFAVNLSWNGGIFKRETIFKEKTFGSDKYETWDPDKFVSFNGYIQEADTWSILYVKVNPGEMYHVKTLQWSSVTGVSFHDLNKDIISYDSFVEYQQEVSAIVIEKDVIVPEGAEFMGISVNDAFNTPDEDYSYTQIRETWDPDKFVQYNRIITEADTWSILYVKVNPGEMYHVKTLQWSAVTGVSFHDLNKDVISYDSFVEYQQEVSAIVIEKDVIVPEGAEFMGISVNDAFNTPDEDYSYTQIRENSKEDQNVLPLYNKKLVSTGDSLVEGAYADEDGNGEKETYAYLAAKQNGMIFVNDGISGSTMSNITANGNYKNGFSDQRYKNIPSDTDYLTIWFGWNDHYYGPIAHKDVYCQENFQKNYQDCTEEEKQQCNSAKDWNAEFLGTDDGTDISTWCGSWNVVLDYLVRNHTEMKIGVMIPFVQGDSLGNGMRSKLITICKKFGVAYLDTGDSDQWPSTGYTEGLSSSMVSFYKDTRTHDGLHDNALGHRLRAQPYANFILRL